MTPLSLMPTMVLIPGGVFQGRTIEPFFLGRTPVTNAEYAAHVDRYRENPFVLIETLPSGGTSITRGNDRKALFEKTMKLARDSVSTRKHRMSQGFRDPLQLGAFFFFELRKDLSPEGFDRPNQPVVNVSWWHAFEYCIANGFHLPTDPQREYAARGHALESTADVGPYPHPPNGFGLFDITGNVWEWTARNPAQKCPYGLRGGIWSSDIPDGMRAGRRHDRHPVYRSRLIGFRVASHPSGKASGTWRKTFKEAVEREGGLMAVAQKTGLRIEILTGYGLGALPTRLSDVNRLSKLFGSSAAAESLWIQAWETAINEMLDGIQPGNVGFIREIAYWKEKYTRDDWAFKLGQILASHFAPKKKSHEGRTQLQRIADEARQDSVPSIRAALGTMSDHDLNALIASVVTDCRVALARKRIARSMRISPGVSEPSAAVIRYTLYQRIIRQSTNDPKNLTTSNFGLEVRFSNRLGNVNIFWVGELVQKSKQDLLKIGKIGPFSVKQIEEKLAGLGLHLGMDVEGWKPPDGGSS